jgi:Secretion system C-terminal sorting domain/Metallo-peptidase family M12B Reprolysin-like
MLSFNYSYAQSNDFFIEDASREQITANERVQEALKLASKDPYLKSVKVVSIGSLDESLKEDFLSVSLGIGAETLEFESTAYNYYGKDDYRWAGKLKKGGGYMFFVSKPEGKVGAIQFNHRFIAIRPVNKELSILLEQDVRKYEALSCEDPKEKPKLKTRSAITDPCVINDGTNCSAIIDVLVLYSPPALTWLNDNWGFWSFFHPFFLEVELWVAAQNSGIVNKEFRCRFNTFTMPLTTNPNTDINALINNQNAQQLRDLYKADMVVLMTNQSYVIPQGPVAGITGTLTVENDRMYDIVEIPFSLGGRWTLAHEMAHAMGARHNRIANGGNDDETDCAHGFNFTDGSGTVQRTILALAGAGQDRLLHFSNPNIQFNNAATGTANDDNARAIRNTGCTVAAFRPSPEWSVSMSVYGIFCSPGDEMNFYANVTTPAPSFPGFGPYSYQWFWTTSSAFNTNNLLGTDPQLTLSSSLGNVFWMHLVVTSADGQEIVVSRRVRKTCAYELRENNVNNTLFQTAKIQDMSISPNPSNGIFEIVLNIQNDEGRTSLGLFDTNGKQIKSITNEVLAKGQHSVKLDLSNIQNGIYICKLNNNSQNQILKLIKTN